jgi:hypothetical protein
MIQKQFYPFKERFENATQLAVTASWLSEAGIYTSNKLPFSSPLDALEYKKKKRLNPHADGFSAAEISGSLDPAFDYLRQGASVRNVRQSSQGLMVRVNSGKTLPESIRDPIDYGIESNYYGNIKLFDDHTMFDDIVGRIDPQSYLEDPGTQQYPIVMYDLEQRSLHLTDGVIEPLTIKGSLSVGSEIPFLAHGIKGAVMGGNIEPEDGSDFICQFREYTSGSVWLEPFFDAQESAITDIERNAWTILHFTASIASGDAIILTGSSGNASKFEFTNVSFSTSDGHKAVSIDAGPDHDVDMASFVSAINSHNVYLGITALSQSNGILLTQDIAGKKGNTDILSLGGSSRSVLSGSLVDEEILKINKSKPGFIGGTDRWILSAPGFTSDFVRGIVKFDDSYSLDNRGIKVISGSIRDEGLINHNQKSSGAGFTYGNNPLGTDSIAFGGLSRS